MKRQDYVITIKVKSYKGIPPDVRTLCGDTVFMRLDEGQSATWTVKKAPKVKL